jgi:hypothetical protein
MQVDVVDVDVEARMMFEQFFIVIESFDNFSTGEVGSSDQAWTPRSR